MMVTNQDIQYWINKTGEELKKAQRFTKEFSNIERRLFDVQDIFREIFEFEAHSVYFRNSCWFAKTVCDLENPIFLYIEEFEKISEYVYVKKIEFVLHETLELEDVKDDDKWKIYVEDENYVKLQKKLKKWGRFYIAEIRLYLSRIVVKK